MSTTLQANQCAQQQYPYIARFTGIALLALAGLAFYALETLAQLGQATAVTFWNPAVWSWFGVALLDGVITWGLYRLLGHSQPSLRRFTAFWRAHGCRNPLE